jgi:hypothetical protein
MVGDRDVVTVEHAARLHALVPNGALAVLPATDPISVMSRPSWVADMLIAFLTEERKS